MMKTLKNVKLLERDLRVKKSTLIKRIDGNSTLLS
jgi:hypothetical protein